MTMMHRLSPYFWLACFAFVVRASILSSEGELLIFERITRRPRAADGLEEAPISAEAARSIIASRLGVDRFHDLSSGSEADYNAINTYAGSQHVFDEPDNERPVALILLDGIAIKDGNIPPHHELRISSMPNKKATDALLADLVPQLMAVDGMTNGYEAKINATQMLHEGAVFRSRSASIRKISSPSTEKDISLTVRSLLDTAHDVLILSSPSMNILSSASWGTWTVPFQHTKRFFDKEEPLEPPHGSSSTTSSSHRQTSSPEYDQSKPLRGILPACFTSRAICESTTRNCTGHGACALKYTNKDVAEEGSSSGGRACWSCMCEAEVRTNPDGSKKTTRYGGPACQKKDIIAPFWLIAGFSITMASLVSWGIGNLWSMGEQQLPSVIGAGVSGPPKR